MPKKHKFKSLSFKERILSYNENKYTPEWYSHKDEIRKYYLDILTNPSLYKSENLVAALFDLYYIQEEGDSSLVLPLLNSINDSVKVATLHFLGRSGKWDIVRDFIHTALSSSDYSVEVKSEALFQLSQYLDKNMEALRMIYELLEGNKYVLPDLLYCDTMLFACEFAKIEISEEDRNILWMNEDSDMKYCLEQKLRKYFIGLLMK